MTSPLWIAQRHGQDWEDPDCLAAIAWLTQGLPSRAWSNRMEAVQTTFEAAKVRWAQGERVSLFDPADAAAWYVFQARAYAADREHWFEPEAYRIVPLFRRIGQLLPQLKPVEGAEDRVVEMMTRYRRQPDDGLYELLFFGSSRMIQLIEGAYSPSVQYSLDGSWRPAKDRPFHAAQVGRVSAVSWLSASEKAQSRKAKHFRKLIREAADQLPGDRPGVVHVGYEAFYDDATEALRHALNHLHIRELDVSSSRLRYVYANYMAPEHTNDRNESSALTETTATYPVGTRSTAEPLKHHLLFADAEPSPGPFWAQRR